MKLPTYEDILALGIKDQLPQLIEGQYPKFKGINKVEVLKLCEDLKKAELLDIHLASGADGVPLPAYGDYIRVTVKGREYLEQIKSNKPLRKYFLAILAYIIGIITPVLVKFLEMVVDIFGKQHGLEK